ncbi:MAG: hypothetical protein WEB05_07640 [Solirubrobacterales bacterium]
MSTGSHRLTETVLIRFGLLAGFALLLALFASSPASAAEEPFTLEFNGSSIESELLSSFDAEGLSGPSSIEGTIDDAGRIKIPKGKFKLPVLDVSAIAQPLVGIDLPVEIEGYMGIEQAATGTFDSETGEMEIQTKAGLWVSINTQQLLGSLGGFGVELPPQLSLIISALGQNLTCGFSPMNVTFTTESTSLSQGQRFTRGLDGPGALTSEWSQLGPFAGKNKILGFIDACTAIQSLLPGLISGIGGGAVGGLDLGSLLESLDEVDLGPTGLTITRVVDLLPEPKTGARLTMAVASEQSGSRSAGVRSFKVTVRNLGETAASGTRVCATAPRRAVRGVRCIALGRIGPGTSKKAAFRLSLSRSAPRSAYKVTFRMSASGERTSVRTALLILGRR